MDQAVILSAVRTPDRQISRRTRASFRAQLGAKAVAEAVRRAGIEPATVDEIIMGNVVQAGLGQNPARQAGLGAGLDVRVAAMTINKVCGSGLKAVGLAAQGVMLGEVEIVVAGGMESMSNCPYLLPGARTGYRFGNAEVVDSMVHDGSVGRVQRFSYGHYRGAGGGKIRHHAAGAGSISVWRATSARFAPENPASSNHKSCPSRFRRRKAIPS